MFLNDGTYSAFFPVFFILRTNTSSIPVLLLYAAGLAGTLLCQTLL